MQQLKQIDQQRAVGILPNFSSNGQCHGGKRKDADKVHPKLFATVVLGNFTSFKNENVVFAKGPIEIDKYIHPENSSQQEFDGCSSGAQVNETTHTRFKSNRVWTEKRGHNGGTHSNGPPRFVALVPRKEYASDTGFFHHFAVGVRSSFHVLDALHSGSQQLTCCVHTFGPVNFLLRLHFVIGEIDSSGGLGLGDFQFVRRRVCRVLKKNGRSRNYISHAIRGL